ncbi:MAG: helicase-related protein [Pseudomonadota bacterium]
MLANPSGLIGLPLRLLAREVYQRVVDKIGPEKVALITGEEKILPGTARYFVSTVEAMPLDVDVDFVAIDEVQLAGDLERGRIFTDRMLRVRGRHETLLLGALTARKMLEKIIPGLNIITRPRMSVLSYSGDKKLTRLPPRSAIVAFSANEVYAIAELIRRQRGGAAIVMGALSPRTRNAQVELFQSGDVDFLVATDAIGMGLNLDVDHVAFASNRKFDGYQHRALSPAELAQIAGRAGRHTRDGTFGVTAKVSPFDNELIHALESHAFAPLRMFQWRNSDLSFQSIADLRASLDEPAQEEGLTKAPPADDQRALEHAAKAPEIMDLAATPERVTLLWDVCQIPDYRKIAPANHADLILTLYRFLVEDGAVADDWIAHQVRYADRTDGDIDTLSNRIAHVRTWTFVANRNDWLSDPLEWRETTRQVEDRLSDALHERLMQRFVDRRTSVLMKRLRENVMLDSEVNDAGDVIVEGQHVGVLHGFRFQADASGGDPRDQKALRAAAAKALVAEMDKRADKLAAAPDTAFTLGSDAGLRWQGALVGKLTAGIDALTPNAVLLADDTLPPPAKERVQARLSQWVSAHISGLLKPLVDLKAAEGLEGGARGLAYRLSEGLGSVERAAVAEEAKALDQPARAGLRNLGVRFGAYHIFVPALLKPAPSQLLALLWALKEADLEVTGLTEVPQLSASGRTSIPVQPDIPPALYGVVGFRVCGPRAVRIDILERLADQIRPLVAWRPGPDAGDPPPGAVPSGGAFLVTVTMTSLLGCSGEDFAAVLTSLGYRVDRREANEAERAAILSAQQVRRAAPKKAAKPTRAAAALNEQTAGEATGEPVQADVPANTEQPSTQDPPAETADAATNVATDAPAVEVENADHPAAASPQTSALDAQGAVSGPEPGSIGTPQSAADETAQPVDGLDEGSLETPLADSLPAAEGVSSTSSAAEGDTPLEPSAQTSDVATSAEPTPEPAPGAPSPEPAVTALTEGAGGAEASADPLDADGTAQTEAADGALEEQTAGAGDPSAMGAPSDATADAGTTQVEPAADAGATQVEPAADAAPEVAEAQEPAVEEADASPVIIEIWRVPRHQRGGEAQRRRRPQRSAEGGSEPGERRDSRRRPKRGPAPQGDAARADQGAGVPNGQAAGPAREGAKAGEGAARPERKDRPEKRGKKRAKPSDKRVEANRPPKREREADPDSPFAALAALKQQMEKGSGDR